MIVFLLFLPGAAAWCQDGVKDIRLLSAEHHPIQYYLSLPSAWSPDRKWPVVVVLEAAEKQYKENIERFIVARGEMPFILVAPIIVSNGRQGLRDPAVYPYAEATWDLIDRIGVCTFDLEGLQEILKDVRRLYSGEARCYLTGFEAGTHLLWAYLLLHPQEANGAAAVAGNFIGRCVESGSLHRDAAAKNVPIRILYGDQDTLFSPAGRLYYQVKDAKALASRAGYQNITEQKVRDAGHVPMPREVLTFFDELSRVRTHR